MNDGVRDVDASEGSMKKGIIIGIVVIVNAAVFTLGYFVGKLTATRGETAPALVEVAKAKPVEPPLQHESAQASVVSQTPPAVTDAKAEDQKTTLPGVSHQGAVPEKTEKAAPRAGPVAKGEMKETAPPPASSSAQPAPGKAIVYTVQLGAFKSQTEAENVKAKFDKKGYKTYIMQVKGKTGKVYKVRTGEFSEKKDAEVLSLKLKKTEGVSAFVTFRNE